jgi:hypothetical protein
MIAGLGRDTGHRGTAADHRMGVRLGQPTTRPAPFPPRASSLENFLIRALARWLAQLSHIQAQDRGRSLFG